MMEWINVDDRLPEDGIQVLLRGSSSYSSSKYHYESGRYSNDRKAFVDDACNRITDGWPEPDSWCYLPEPPE